MKTAFTVTLSNKIKQISFAKLFIEIRLVYASNKIVSW